MKHRKFLKQLMAVGVERNKAQLLAKIAQQLGVGYFKALGDFLTLGWILRHNALADSEVWQIPGANVWEGVLANE